MENKIIEDKGTRLAIIIVLTILILLTIFIVTVMFFKAIKDYGCYKNHVQECLECHSQNLTYLLCSGFCVPPRYDDNNYSCTWGLNKSCEDLPKECNL
jgi:hypothetical protein